MKDPSRPSAIKPKFSAGTAWPIGKAYRSLRTYVSGPSPAHLKARSFADSAVDWSLVDGEMASFGPVPDPQCLVGIWAIMDHIWM